VTLPSSRSMLFAHFRLATHRTDHLYLNGSSAMD
jgi:hypothetical protein